ncbi:PspC domain-containing protein [Sediminicola sp. YIK13]|uniref:PspC domain-containing protein n=1 Tax=Sediminicola sp. YIK13 TaxID=1453352 RepID=UPI0009E831D4|nr:PspC domain-containing protein [Sediminicola sp. YIK13]
MSNQNNDDVELKSNNKSDSDLKQKKSNFTKILYRNTNKKVFGGVCSGLANYFGISVILVRILWLILSIFFCFGIIIYIILWIAIPDKKYLESDLDKSDNNSNRDKSNSTKEVVKNSFSVLGIIVIGCFLGFWGGWEYGRSLGYTGGESMGTLMIALSGFVFGGVLASIIGVIIVRKNK